MNIRHAWLLVVAPLVATLAIAQDRGTRRGPPPPETVTEKIQQTYTELDEKSLQDAPKRDFKIKTETDPVKTKLYRADPKLLENKFVAQFGVIPGQLDRTDPKSVQAFRNQQTAEDYLKLSYPRNLQLFAFFGERRSAIGQKYKELAENCPPEHRPNERLVEFLSSDDGARDVRTEYRSILISTPTDGSGTLGSRAPSWQFVLYAPSAEVARERAAAILQLLDCGLSRPMQRFALEQGKAALAEARQAESEVAAANKAIESERAKLEKPSEISADILSQLKAQKIMVAIELSGLSARVRACDEMLVKELPASTLASIGDMKVKAEIDRVGIKEKLDRINALIGEGDARQAASARLLTLTRAKERAQSSLSSAQTTAAWYADIYELYAPLQLEGNQITISPIEWTN